MFTENPKNGTFILTITLYRRKSHLSIADKLQTKDQNLEGTAPKGSAVTRALDILEAVAIAERPLTPSELCEQLGIPKATVHRLCSGMEERGLLESRINGRGLLPGKNLYRLALGVLASAPFRAQRHAVLTALSETIGETCNISIPEGSTMIYFDRVETHWPVRVQLPVGSRVPVYCTASGKMYLSGLPAAKQRRILTSLTLEKHTANTLTDVDAAMNELAATAARGYSLDNEEYLEGMIALAVPLKDASGQPFATLSFHAPSMRVDFSEAEQYLGALQSAAAELEAISSD